jgi:hypothetical protein
MAYRDGIVDKEIFNNSKIKILWILKEVNHDGDICDWDMSKVLQSIITNKGIETGWEKTFGPIVHTTYGILNQKKWDEIPYYYDKPEIVNVLKEIAYINVNKTSGDSITHFSTLENAYIEYKSTLFEQINEINPSIIIYGGTYYLFENDIEENVINKNIKHIDAYHPAQRKITHEKYCNQIIEEAIKI